MLKRNTSVRVNAAWPAANEIAAGVIRPAGSATGSRNHRSVVFVPIGDQQHGAEEKPTAVPSRPRSAFCPVLSAFDRSTDRVPRRTQKECCTPVQVRDIDAIPKPTAPRTLLCSHTERRSRWALARARAAPAPGTPSGRRPSSRSSQPRRSAAEVTRSMLRAMLETAQPTPARGSSGQGTVMNSSAFARGQSSGAARKAPHVKPAGRS